MRCLKQLSWGLVDPSGNQKLRVNPFSHGTNPWCHSTNPLHNAVWFVQFMKWKCPTLRYVRFSNFDWAWEIQTGALAPEGIRRLHIEEILSIYLFAIDRDNSTCFSASSPELSWGISGYHERGRLSGYKIHIEDPASS